MNCKCIEEIEARVVKEFKFKGKHPITKCDIESAIIFGDTGLYSITCSEMELTVEGMKRNQTQKLMHSYCPFCGVKIEKK